MKGTAGLFFGTGVICVIGGMTWGIVMAATGDHLLSPAHGHLNLVGWVTMALFGIYYHLTPQAEGKLARTHYLIALAGVCAMVPGIAMAIEGKTEGLAILGSFLTMISMLIFGYTVFKNRGGNATA